MYKHCNLNKNKTKQTKEIKDFIACNLCNGQGCEGCNNEGVIKDS